MIQSIDRIEYCCGMLTDNRTPDNLPVAQLLR
jgi:hypothetical protein